MKIVFMLAFFCAATVQAMEVEKAQFFVAGVLELNYITRHLNICLERTPMEETERCWTDQTALHKLEVDLKNLREFLSAEPGLARTLVQEQQEQLQMDLDFLADMLPQNFATLRADADKDLDLLNPQFTER